MRIGVVGHRRLSAGSARFVGHACASLLGEFAHRGRRVTALSALAEGADSIFARAALTRRVPLMAVQPHKHYLDDFTTMRARAEYLTLWSAAHERAMMPFQDRSTDAYAAAMRWVTDRSDILIAVWDGLPSSDLGGTYDTVEYARSIGRPIVHLEPLAQSVFFG